MQQSSSYMAAWSSDGGCSATITKIEYGVVFVARVVADSLITRGMVAQLAGVTDVSVARWIKKGTLKPVKRRPVDLFRVADVREIVKAREGE